MHSKKSVFASYLCLYRSCLHLELHNNHTCIQAAASALQGGTFRNDHEFRAHIIHISYSYSVLDVAELQCNNNTTAIFVWERHAFQTYRWASRHLITHPPNPHFESFTLRQTPRNRVPYHTRDK